MNKPQEAGYRIRGTFYPVPTSRRLTDAALIEQLTGLTVQEYVRRARAQIDEANEAAQRFQEAREHGDLPEDAEMEIPEFDELVSLAGIGIAVSRVHPGWSRTRVHDFVASLENDEIDFVGGAADDDQDEADEERPPALTETDSKPGSTSPPPSRSDSETRSNGSETPRTSGRSTSPMSPVER